MKKYRAFTLVELLIVLVLVGILTVILMRSYTWISQVAFRVEQTKHAHQEVLHLSQILQNFVDRNTIDYSRYASGSLQTSYGVTRDLYLSGQDGLLHVYVTGDCTQFGSGTKLLSGACLLMLERSGTAVALNDIHMAVLRNPVFKIIPFASSDAYLQQDASCPDNDYLHCIQTPGFRFLTEAYSPNYGPTWVFDVHLPVQLFFSK